MDIENYNKTIESITKEAAEVSFKLDDSASDLKIDGKNLELCCVQHASLLAYYDEIQVRLKYNLNRLKMFELKMRGELYVHCKETFKKEYTDTAIKMVIDSNPNYVKLRETVLMVEEIYDKAVSVVESFKTRSFDLRNIIAIREAELENIIIRAG